MAKIVKIAKIEKLPLEEEYELIRKAQSGDHKSIEFFITRNEGLIRNHLRRYKSLRNVRYEDLHQQCLLGVIEAVNHFTFDKKVRFATYLTSWLLAMTYRYVVYMDACVNLPAAHFDSKDNPDKVGITAYGLDSPIDDKGSTVAEYYPDENALEFEGDLDKSVANKKLLDAVSKLDDRSALIIKLHFFKEYSIPKIASLLESTKSGITYELKRALEELLGILKYNDVDILLQ
jgi:RNA polymerase sigma factor (sigma-70 family)